MTTKFTSRILLFDDNTCIGLFVDDSKKKKSNSSGSSNGCSISSDNVQTAIIMSPTGDFVFITRTDESAVNHLTRFVPSRFASQVQILLVYRNKHATKPFLCERFSIEEDHNSSSVVVGNESQLCPFGRRLLNNSIFQFYVDSIVDTGHHNKSDMHVPNLYHLSRVFPAGLVEKDFMLSLDVKSQIGAEVSSSNNYFDSFCCSASESGLAYALFLSIRGELSFLFDRDVYLAPNAARMLRCEQVDDCTYTINGSIGTLKYSEIREYDAWLDPAEDGTVLTLRGDYVVLHWLDNAQIRKHEVHLSLVDLGLESNECSVKSEFDSPISKLRSNKFHILHLLNFREQFEKHRPSFESRKMPLYLCRSKQHSQMSDVNGIPGEPIHLTVDGIRFTALTRNVDGKEDIYRIHGMFPDHTLLVIDMMTRVVSAILSGGETTTYELATCVACIDPSILSCMNVSSTEDRRTTSLSHTEPTTMVARHVKSLMAFRRWAGTPAHLRHSLVVADNRLSTIARASVLQSQRFLVLQELSNGQVTHEPAAEKAFSLSQSLHFAGRDSLFQFTERSVEEEEQMIKTANILAELQIIKDSKPKAETDPLQYRQKVQARARNALSENQDSINKNRKFLESCRVNNAVI